MGYTVNNIAKSLKKYLPTGILHNAVNIPSTNIYKMFTAFAKTFKRECDTEEYLRRELNPETTYDLISDWETFVGIPDSCFSNVGDVEQRRKQVITKLTAQVQTAQDFIDLAAELGVEVDVYPKAVGGTGFPMELPYELAAAQEDYFTIIVDIIGWSPTGGFPLTLPYELGEEAYSSIVQCLFDKLKPAHCAIEYI